MNSKIDNMDLKSGLKDVLKNVGKNIGKIQDFKNTETSKGDNTDSKVGGFVWDKSAKETEDKPESNIGDVEIKPTPNNTNNDKDEKSPELLDLKINNLERTTVFTNKLYMWISN
jgi:hypothetical protein